MTAIVRVFTYSSLMSAPVSSTSGRLATDSVSQLKQPYLVGERLEPDTTTPAISSSDTAPGHAKLALIQVQSGKQVHYEVTTENSALRTVSDASPVLSGDVVIHFGPGWRLSFLEATAGDA